ncbi:nucleic acid binding [Mactra antiquata]
MAGMQDLVGRRVKITLDDGLVVSGFIHSYGANDEKLSLEKVECIENGARKRLVGLQHYFAEEIVDLVVTEEVCKKQKHKIESTINDSQRNNCIMGKKHEPPHLARLQNVNYQSLVLKTKKTELTSSGSENNGSSGIEQDVLPQSDEYTIISKLSNTFYEAMAYIRKYSIIGVSVEGVVIGRAGKLCWFQIAVPDHIFLFDVLSIGKACFDEGIKELLETEDILKVFHDCRMVSDMLHHQYNIKLVNVFDTQVANVFVYRLKHHQDWPRYVEGLSSCLFSHMNLSVEDVNWSVVREQKREEDEMVWMERPPQRHIVEAAVKNVKHLLELRTILMEKMMEEYVAGVNIYLMHVRDASDHDSSRYQSSPHLLPYAFQDLHAFMSSYNIRSSIFQQAVDKDPNGFRDNSYGISRPNVYFSRDSIWHSGRKRLEQTNNQATSSKVTEPMLEDKHETQLPTAQPSSSSSLPPQLSSLQNQQSSSSLPKQASSLLQKQASSSLPKQASSSLPKQESSSLPKQSPETKSAMEEMPCSRSNLSSRTEIEAVNEALSKMNAAKLSKNNTTTRPTMNSSQYVQNLDQLNDSQSTDDADQEKSAGSLMRALVYEQDKAGFECNSGIDNFSILPAGRIIREKKQKRSKQNFQESNIPSANMKSFASHVNGYSHGNQRDDNTFVTPNRSRYENIESVIPGGDIVTHSPPMRKKLSAQERMLLERMQNQQSISQTQYESPSVRTSQPQSDHDSPPSNVKQPNRQRYNILQMQLQGRKPSNHIYHSESECRSDSVQNTRAINNDFHHQSENSYRSQSFTSSQGDSMSPSNQTSGSSKLDSVLEKLRLQSLNH